MSEVFYKRDIIRLGDEFGFYGKGAWELIRNGRSIIIDEKYLFLKKEKGDYSGGPESFDDDFGYGIIDILDVITGNGEEFKYNFYCKHGDYHDQFQLGVLNIMKMYKYRTGKEADLSLAFKHI